MGLSNGLLLGLLTLALGCTAPQAPPVKLLNSDKPKRIVSLDYCADQFVLKLADRQDILALSPDATRDFSYLRHQALGINQVRPSAEDILALKPDLIVRSYGGGPTAPAFFERAGVQVHQIGFGNDFEAVRKNVREAAHAVGQVTRGARVIAEFDRRLHASIPVLNVATLYMTSGGVTTGTGSMIDLMLKHAGLVNFQNGAGWNALPLERLVSDKPDMIATAFFGASALIRDHWSSSRHQIVQNILRSVPVVALDGSTTACAGWFVMDGVEALAQAGRRVQP